MREDNVTHFFSNVCDVGGLRDKTDAHLTILHRSPGGSLGYLVEGRGEFWKGKKKGPGEVWEKVWMRISKRKKIYIYPRPNYQQTAATLICFGARLSRGTARFNHFGKKKEIKNKKINKWKQIWFHLSSRNWEKRKELLPRGRLITVYTSNNISK